jgi:hypothetical protein
MELSPAQRKLAFAVVVFVLVGLGVYLITSRGSGSPQHPASPGHTARVSPPPVTTSPVIPTTAPPTSAPPRSASPTTGTPDSATAPNIYQWVPFTRAGLGQASATAVRFGDAYGTFSYTEGTKAYVNSLRTMVTNAVAGQISAAYGAPGVARLRTQRKQVSTGSASITSLRAFGSTSLTFVLSVTEKITATKGGGRQTTSYAVTLIGGGHDWQVSSIELASAGNS